MTPIALTGILLELERAMHHKKVAMSHLLCLVHVVIYSVCTWLHSSQYLSMFFREQSLEIPLSA